VSDLGSDAVSDLGSDAVSDVGSDTVSDVGSDTVSDTGRQGSVLAPPHPRSAQSRAKWSRVCRF